MGCLFSSDTKVQPFDHTTENGVKSAPRQNGSVPSSHQNGTISQSKQKGSVPSSHQNGTISQSKKNGSVSSSHQNGTVPKSKQNGHIKNTQRETLCQLPNEKEASIVNHAANDTRIVKETDGQELATIQSVASTIQSEQYRMESETSFNKATDQTRTSGDQTERSIESTRTSPFEEKEPIIVPTMPIKEEGLLRSHYTIKQVSIHNQSKGYVDIFPLRKNIYSTTKFKEAMKKVVEKKYKDLEDNNAVVKYDNEDFDKIWKFNPIFLVLFRFRKMYLRFSDIKAELTTCKVAEVLDEGELYEDIMNDSKAMLNDLKNDSQRTKYQEEYMELLQRFLDICESLLDKAQDSFSSLPPVANGQDPNTIEFPLPEGIEAESLQQWIVSWEPLDMTTPPDGVWIQLPDNVVNALSEPLELHDICRVSLDGLPALDFTINGEVAWNVIDADIVKFDKTTEEQENTWRSRDNRTDLNDPMFLLRRQTKIEMYFINKYEWDSAKLDPYRGFVSRLQKSWKEFQSLCEVEDFSVVPEDEY